MKNQNNRTFATAMVAAAADIGKTVSGVKLAYANSTEAKQQAARNGVTVAARKPASAMATIAEGKATTKKEPNYTEAQEKDLLAAYADGVDPEDIAAMLGKTKRSIIAKLVRAEVYKKAEYVNKATGEKPVSKADHVATIAAFMGVTADKLESLDKATKNVLVLVEDSLKVAAHKADNEDDSTPEEKASKADSIKRIASVIGSEHVNSLALVARATLQALAFALTGDVDESEQKLDTSEAQATA